MTNAELITAIKTETDKDKIKQLQFELYNQNKSFIYTISKKYDIEKEDAMQEGFIAMIKALEYYEEAKGSFLNVFEMHLKTQFRKLLNHNISESMLNDINKYKKIYAILSQNTQQKPTDKALCIELYGLPTINNYKKLEEIKKYIKNTSNIVSLEETMPGAEEQTIKESLKSDENIEENIIENVFNEELKNIVWETVDKLKPIERDIIINIYKNNSQQVEIAKNINLSTARIGQIHKSALKTLKNYHEIQELYEAISNKSYLELGLNSVGVNAYHRNYTSSTEYAVFKIIEFKEKLNKEIQKNIHQNTWDFFDIKLKEAQQEAENNNKSFDKNKFISKYLKEYGIPIIS